MITLEMLESDISDFITNGINEETKIINLSNGVPLGVIEIFRHKSIPLYVLSLKTKPGNAYSRRYSIRRGEFDHFGLGKYCETDRDIVSYQIHYGNYQEAFSVCCHIAKIYKEDPRLLNPRGGDFFIPEIPEGLLQILDGAIAGDGGVYNRYSSSIFQYTLGGKQLGHLEEFKSEIEKYGYSGKIGEYTKLTVPSRDPGCRYYQLTWTLKAFNKLRVRWYRGKQKIVPKDLKNSPVFWKWFYAGDGCLNVLSDYSYRVYISTNDFLTEDVDRLISMLSQIGVKSTKYLKRNTPSSGLPQWIIAINVSKYVDRFLEYIGPAVKSVEYKWMTPTRPNSECPSCGLVFRPNRSYSKYCSFKCQRKEVDARRYNRNKTRS